MKNELEAYLHEHIPLSKAMGVHVQQASYTKVILQAAYAPNINHKHTVFGGSLHSVTTLACWSVLHLKVHNALHGHYQIVITESNTSYLRPVASNFTAACEIMDNAEWNRFLKILSSKGKSRIKLSASYMRIIPLLSPMKPILQQLKSTYL